MSEQLLREFPPGFGGVERVAHCLSSESRSTIYCFGKGFRMNDPLPVSYRRVVLPSVCFGRIFLPLPSIRILHLLVSKHSLIAHLPCPTVLAIAILAKLFKPSRDIKLYLHSILSPRQGLQGILEMIYQRIAFIALRFFPVIVTSPNLKNSLLLKGISSRKLIVLPCSLPPDSEKSYDLIFKQRLSKKISDWTIIFMGRLDSYKRVDWLIQSFSDTRLASKLFIVGEGPDRYRLEKLAGQLVRHDQTITFYGCVNEDLKLQLLIDAHVLVLPANQSNEAFGIVQLEAMASGIPSLAFDLPDSGMHWVSQLPSLEWSGQPQDLPSVLQKLLDDKALYATVCAESRKRYEQEFSIDVWRQNLLTLNEVDA